MRRASLSFAVLAFAMLVFSLAANAAIYTVTLSNGGTVETRYQPQRASWDAGKIVLMTEFGNQISLAAADVVSVAVDTETRGFGHQLDNTTIAMGWAPNDATDPASPEGQAAAAAEQAAAQAQGLAPVYNQLQFVEPSATTGMPVWMTGVNAVPQVGQQPQAFQPVAAQPPPNQ